MSDFFQKIKNAASTAAAATEKAAKDASDSAKKMAEKSRIKREITTLETKLSADFREIGQKLYNESNGAPDESYAVLFAAIEDGQKAIAAKNEELAMVDTSRACPSCGKRIKQDATFCAQCGAKVEQPAPAPAPATYAADTKPCPGCGAALAVSAMFCPECGTKVAQEPAPAPAAQPEQAFTPQEPAMIACPGCGAQVKADAVFCPECGGRVAAQPEVLN